MNDKRTTIYDLAEALSISVSYVSKALNNHPSISDKVKEKVKKKATELNYKHNSQAANLRRGHSRTMGVIVPKINQSFFSEAIAGIEEACWENNYSLVIYQSHETFERERQGVETLIHQNVDCILISISKETRATTHFDEIKRNNIAFIQFDRCTDNYDCLKVTNDNLESTYKAVKHLIGQDYKRIAFLGGPDHVRVFHDRKIGFLKAMDEAQISIPYNYIIESNLLMEDGFRYATQLLTSNDPPDAFFAVADLLAIGVLDAAEALKINVPASLGIFGYANEEYSNFVKPSISTIDQHSKQLGKHAAELFFASLTNGEAIGTKTEIIESEIVVRKSSRRN
ncbi:LacI family DNA-binding transcriptional regulator [Mucilaginibacter sp. SJ]|uniref:LacI family DNA-binding transcriptional regulator n=1 Tax=Mucilaginibacter sp. SJ TaxID=3029053 RepID=UPI0023A9B55B|nr:LacI family DNA-binding transcriptional regulator [Mucilaginibacter sp. SJ]WEA00619.1 LacI family DNA-binding transcriptional regulator [Mucilaginibacter sp. SJ]